MFYINQGTSLNSGSGYPVTERIEYLFSSRKDTKQVEVGLMKVPLGKIPPFQIHVLETTFVRCDLIETTGQGQIGSINLIPITAFAVDSINKGGVDYTSWSLLDTYTIGGVSAGRYFIRLVLTDEENEKEYFVEEFLMSNCC